MDGGGRMSQVDVGEHDEMALLRRGKRKMKMKTGRGQVAESYGGGGAAGGGIYTSRHKEVD